MILIISLVVLLLTSDDDVKQLRWKLRSMKYHLVRMSDKFYSNADEECTLSYAEARKQQELNKEKFFKLLNECFYDI